MRGRDGGENVCESAREREREREREMGLLLNCVCLRTGDYLCVLCVCQREALGS